MYFDPLRRWITLNISWLVAQVFVFVVDLLFLLLIVNFNLQILPARAQIEVAIAIIVLPLYWIGSIIQARRLYNRSVLRRQQMLSGEWQQRAQVQPTTQDTALPLPIMLSIRLNWAFLVPIFILIILCFGIMFALTWTLYSLLSDLINSLNYSNAYVTSTATTMIPLDTWLTYMILVYIWWAGCIIVGFFVNLNLHRRLCPMLEATEEGLTASYPGKKVTMRWSDVRYFALVMKKKSPEPMNATYEIGDGKKIIRWQQPYSIRRTFPFYVPTLPRNQYNKQFASLLSLIAIRTGLPLLDMHLS